MVALLALVLVAPSCSSKDPFDHLPDPEHVDLESTTSTSEVDLTGVPLSPVEGSTTTSVAMGPGPMTIVGHVQGPDGMVAGAIVQLERLVGDGSASTRVPTAADGTWNLENVLGGRYRVRAWKAPALASRPQVVFMEATPQRALDITLDAVGGVRVDAAVAPDPPIVDEQVNLKVRVAQRTVDTDGLVTDDPVAGATVELAGSGEWVLDSPNPSRTGDDGSTVFRATCEDEGVQPLFASLSDGSSYALTIPACVDPDSPSTASSSTTTTEP